jgi:hypothetical protein
MLFDGYDARSIENTALRERATSLMEVIAVERILDVLSSKQIRLTLGKRIAMAHLGGLGECTYGKKIS